MNADLIVTMLSKTASDEFKAMSNIRWLNPIDGPDALPEPHEALIEPNGLLAAGGSLTPDWLLESYARGIFPWYESGQPILWWSPDPRAVLLPENLVVSRSLRKTLRRDKFRVTADCAFDRVVEACALPRRYTDATWITGEMAAAYRKLHELGRAHSFEAWCDGELAGGLYGVALGQIFFGESMFTQIRDASKVAFVHAVEFLRTNGFRLIDCQIPSEHLQSLGACNLPRPEFLSALERLREPEGAAGSWTEAFAATMAHAWP